MGTMLAWTSGVATFRMHTNWHQVSGTNWRQTAVLQCTLTPSWPPPPLPQLPTAVLSTTARAKARAAKKAKEAGQEPAVAAGGAEAMETDKPAGEGSAGGEGDAGDKAGEGDKAGAAGEKKEAEPEPSSFTGG